MKSLILTIAVSLAVSFSISVNGTDCEAGGPGSTSCSITKHAGGNAELTIAGTGGGGGGESSVTYEVTCGSGYYSCCNSTTTSGSATCKPN